MSRGDGAGCRHAFTCIMSCHTSSDPEDEAASNRGAMALTRCATRSAATLSQTSKLQQFTQQEEGVLDCGMSDQFSDQLSVKDHVGCGPTYGELVVLGTNGQLACTPISDKMRHRFTMRLQQDKPSGLCPCDAGTHSIVITHDKVTSTALYGMDNDTDLFQIGRSADNAIDMVVMDTERDQTGRVMYKINSTISRYACRITCDRLPPYTARLFAGAFDTNNRIAPSSMVPSWEGADGDIDCLTTNGVGLLRPNGCYVPGVKPGKWLEVSVKGHMFSLREKRSSRRRGAPVPEESNILTDGCLIDLCGVTLIWRSALGLEQAPSKETIREQRDHLNATEAQCPVNFFTLAYPPIRASQSELPGGRPKSSKSSSAAGERQPWAYLMCGHVCGFHNWKGNDSEDDRNRTCPTCRQVGPYVKLDLGQQTAYCLDTDSPTHVFVPCGHVTSLATVQYWSSLVLPYMVNQWAAQCPFCRNLLNPKHPYTKLIYS